MCSQQAITMTSLGVSPIVLAAGRSERFGSDKLIYSTYFLGQTRPLILHTLQTWLTVFNVVNVVVHIENSQLINILDNSPFRTRLNLIPAQTGERSLSTSLKSGIAATETASAWLIGLADMPFIASSVLKKSLLALQDGAAITLPVYDRQRGHPVGFCSSYRLQLLALTGDHGAKEIIQSSLQSITYIDSPNKGIWLDVDRPEDFEQTVNV